ncbi:hypothetical protein [uncultured Methanobrevibacter sp.]|nr:hypothetical protein [uncultured Methanobrevibacter sp.]
MLLRRCYLVVTYYILNHQKKNDGLKSKDIEEAMVLWIENI